MEIENRAISYVLVDLGEPTVYAYNPERMPKNLDIAIEKKIATPIDEELARSTRNYCSVGFLGWQVNSSNKPLYCLGPIDMRIVDAVAGDVSSEEIDRVNRMCEREYEKITFEEEREEMPEVIEK